MAMDNIAQMSGAINNVAAAGSQKITEDVMNMVRQNLAGMKQMQDSGLTPRTMARDQMNISNNRQQLGDYVDLTGNIPGTDTLNKLGYGDMFGDMAGQPSFATQMKLLELEQAAARAARGGGGTKKEAGFTPKQMYDIMKDKKDADIAAENTLRTRALEAAKADKRLGFPDEVAENTLAQLEDAYYQLYKQRAQQEQQGNGLDDLWALFGG